MNAKTLAAYAEIVNCAERGDCHIALYCIARTYGVRAAAAAFKLAVRHGVIEQAFVCILGCPVYQPIGYVEPCEWDDCWEAEPALC